MLLERFMASWHAVANKFMAAKNATPALTDPVFNECVGRWNSTSAIRNIGAPDFRTKRVDVLEELYELIKDHVGDGESKYIALNPVRVGNQEFLPRVDTKVRFGLAPMIKARLDLVQKDGKKNQVMERMMMMLLFLRFKIIARFGCI